MKIIKEEKGFTLIELLAVIVILSVLLAIAVPSVTKYITTSKKEGFIATAKQFTDAARKEATSETYNMPMGNSNVTIISIELLGLEKGGQTSAFGGSWVYSKSYVVIVNAGTGENPDYKYYFAAQDDKRYALPLMEVNLAEKGDIVRNARDTMEATVQSFCGTKEGKTQQLATIKGLESIQPKDGSGNLINWTALIYSGDKCNG